MTVTTDRQVEYNGLLLEDPIHIQSMTGMGLPELRVTDRPLLARHGLRPGTVWLGGRTIGLELEVVAYDEATFTDAVEALRAAFVPGVERPLVFRLPGIAGGRIARSYARSVRHNLDITSGYWNHAAEVLVELTATDPLLYANEESSSTTALPAAASSGLTFPLTYPRTYGVETSEGSVYAVNEGNYPTPWVARIDGPVTSPSVALADTGEAISLNLSLLAGEYVLIDSRARTVMLMGATNRYSTLVQTSRWWDLQPGTNEVTFRASTLTAAQMTLTWRSAWL